jgi:hypothetical protein
MPPDVVVGWGHLVEGVGMSNVVRDSFTLRNKPGGGYDVVCNVCQKVSVAWDYRVNALSVGYVHVVNEHLATGLTTNAGWEEQ